MMAHYLAVALRAFAKHRAHTAVSVGVLALGLSCFLAAYLVVSHLRSYDRHFANGDRIQVIFQAMEGPLLGFSWPFTPRSSYLLADLLRLDVPELDAVARLRSGNQTFVTVDGEARRQIVGYVDRPFLEIIDFPVVAGELQGALDSPASAIMTARAAESLFGRTDVVGRVITVAERESADVVISAVIADPPRNSQFGMGFMNSAPFDILLSWDMNDALAPVLPYQTTWFNTTVMTYALLPADGSLTDAELDRRLEALASRHVPDAGIDVQLDARPVSAAAAGMFQSRFQGYEGAEWGIDVLTALLIFAGAILAVACVNFVNLASAAAAGRARNVGVRKSLGATAGQLIRQDLMQTGVMAAAATLAAVVMVVALAPLVPMPYRLALDMPWSEPRFWLFLLSAGSAVTLAAGLYPALVLARARPVTALRLGTTRAGSKWLRTLLVGSQFAVASFLIVAIVLLASQRDVVRDRLLGRFESQYVILNPPPIGMDGPTPDVLAAELLKGPGIEGVTSGPMPFWFQGSRQQYSRTPSLDGVRVLVETLRVGHDYFSVMDVPLVAGRVFSRERDDEDPRTAEEYRARATPLTAVLDREAARALGWSNPADAIGEAVYAVANNPQPMPREVIGVVESLPLAVSDRGSRGAIYVMSTAASARTIVRISKDDVARALAHIDEVFAALEPGRPPRGRTFLDQSFESAYWAYSMVSFVFIALGTIAVVIAGAGLFGLASYMTARRTREIGLRKSQGASSGQILRLLIGQFSRPVVVANLAVWPLALIAADLYLDAFTLRVPLTPVPFAVALVATVGIAWVAVGGRVLRAARIRPVEALREE